MSGIRATFLTRSGVKSDFAFGLHFASMVFSDEVFYGVKHGPKLLIVILFHGIDATGEVAIGIHEAPQLHKCAHDGNIDSDGSGRTKHAGKHRDSLFGESVWEISPPSVLPGTHHRL